MSRSFVVIGSGAGGSVVAWALANAGREVVVLERGRHLLPGLGTPEGLRPSLFSNDEVKEGRAFEDTDSVLEPRSGRSQAEAATGVARSYVGGINSLAATVGGGTVHWDAKTPRFWTQDFKGRSLYGPIPGAQVADWPLDYAELAPFYDVVEAQLGVQGDVRRMPLATLAQAPRSRQFPLPAGPAMLAGRLLAEGAARLGHSAYPFPMAVASQPYGNENRCNACGFCSGFGCPITARGSAAVSFLHPAMRRGVQVVPRAFVSRIDVDATGRHATGVRYLDPSGREHRVQADTVVIAASAIETARLLLLSASGRHPDGLGNRSGQVGRNLMFHLLTLGVAMFEREVHAWRGPSTTFTLDDFVGPERVPGSDLPYLKGGLCEVGAGTTPIEEAGFYTALPGQWGVGMKEMMRRSPARRFFAAISMVGEDLPQAANRVDLDPSLRDVHGLPIPRITHTPHAFELAASDHFGPRLARICRSAPGAVVGGWLPLGALMAATGGFSSPYAGPAGTAHVMGTARMGDDPTTSVVDGTGKLHDVDNVYVADGSTFASSGGFNPTLTIMALALRTAMALGGEHPTPDQIVAANLRSG
jgi:choline dehydrogenase-like flavoprotein